TSKMRVEEIEGHLNGIKTKVMPPCSFKHVQMNVGILVSGESDEANLSGLTGRGKRFHSPARGENTICIVEANHLVMLQEIDFVQAQPLQRLVQLAGRRLLGAPVDFGHHESAGPVA